MICGCCRREVDYVRASMWHGEDRICRECFIEWYDPSRDDKPLEPGSREQIGNYVRRQHGLSPLVEEPGG